MAPSGLAGAALRRPTTSGRLAPSAERLLGFAGGATSVLLLTGVALWALSLAQIDLSTLGARNLAVRLPPEWYLALGLSLIAVVTECTRRSSRGWLLASGILVVGLILYATVPAAASAPPYAWTYKHVGVTELILAHGTVEPNVDLYNRWPGLFALAAAFSRATGASPLSFAGWFEPLFTLLDAMVIAAIAQVLTRSSRTAALTALLWLVTDWVGQQYFSPQGLGYFLTLVLLLIVIRQLPMHGAARPRLERWARRLTRAQRDASEITRPGRWPVEITVTVVLILDAAVVLTHQLSPYMVILQLAALTILGLRPRWLVVATALLALAYLAPNLHFLTTHYGSLFAVNPFANASSAPSNAVQLPWIYAHAGEFLTAASVLLAVAGLVRLTRCGQVSTALTLVGLSAAPLALSAGSNYGGEGPLRIILFASAPLAMTIASALMSLTGVRRALAAGLVTSICTGLFLFAFTAYRGTNIFSAAEAHASEYFYARAPAGSVLMFVGQNFPVDAGARYSVMGGDGAASLPNAVPQDDRPLGPPARRLAMIVATLRSAGPNAFIVFSAGERKYFAYSTVISPRAVDRLERQVAASGAFGLWFSDPGARIYRLCDTCAETVVAGRRSRPRR